jgi:hypothetical protein
MAKDTRPWLEADWGPVAQGQQIVEWLESFTDSNRSAAISAEPPANWPLAIVRAYPARSATERTLRYSREASLLAEAGYQPVSETWVATKPGCASVAILGIWAFAAVSGGSLTVTYVRLPTAAALAAQPNQLS